ncbi:triphosphoribosyl-dephospho-CoA synthase [Austwickia chelonae]|uniref:triphosphoribosyl-dephospho-CoA synthase n=1 Tax=Austwickia chelonae TaxID=100225 RepID=UPI000E24AF33|nr:triphosphoribosyl-dephospho-CoA synthase [Austwickia chelonae]
MRAAGPYEEIDLAEMLAARDARAANQSRLLSVVCSLRGAHQAAEVLLPAGERPSGCVLSLSVVVPGPVKTLPWVGPVFDEAVRAVERLCADQGWPVHDRVLSPVARTGPEALWALQAPGPRVKAVVTALEDSHPVGRLWDLDVVVTSADAPAVGARTGVLSPDVAAPIPLSRSDRGVPPRQCLVCGRPSAECARSPRHPLPQVLAAARRLVGRWELGEVSPAALLAYDCLLAEVHHTPKPGLVDLRNTGAHHDMDVPMFEASAAATVPGLALCEQIGTDQARAGGELPDALPRLRTAGLSAEARMAEVTGGVNTHRGAIFAFGLLCAAVGWLKAAGHPVDVDTVCSLVSATAAPTLADLPDVTCPTHGLTARAAYGMAGARGEAASGFVTVRVHALPAYEQVWAVSGDRAAAAGQALLELMAHNEDTNLVARGGPAAVELVQNRARGLLASGGTLAPGHEAAMRTFDDELIAEGLSPGGVADLLGVTLFLAHLDKTTADGTCGAAS